MGRRKYHFDWSEATAIMIPLTLAGGFQDAYSYFVRGGVFANALTGNIVLMASHFFTGEFELGIRYVFPFSAFALGFVITDQLHSRLKINGVFHWRHVILAIEFCLLVAVAFLPMNETGNRIANVMSSFACAMQVQAFRKVNGYAYASTMCIGNVRSGAEAFSAFLRTGDSKNLTQAWQYFLITFVFFLGAGLGSVVTKNRSYAQYTIFIAAGLLLFSFILMSVPRFEKDLEA